MESRGHHLSGLLCDRGEKPDRKGRERKGAIAFVCDTGLLLVIEVSFAGLCH
jgi:hypothetical protein